MIENSSDAPEAAGTPAAYTLRDSVQKTAEDTSQNRDELPESLAKILYSPQSLTVGKLEKSGLRVAYVPGTMPGKWFTRWHERFGDRVPLAEIPVAQGQGLTALETEITHGDGTADAQAAEQQNKNSHPHDGAQEEQPQRPANPLAHLAILRTGHEPDSLDQDKYHSITLYDEVPVIIMPSDHVLTVLDEVSFEDLAEEFLLHEPSLYPVWEEISRPWRAENPRFLPDIANDREAIELVAAGIGLYLAPMSVARFYHRKDLTYRPMLGAEPYPVTLTFKRACAQHPRSEDEETILQDFIGIVRGRTASSERGSETQQNRSKRLAQQKAKTKAKNRAAHARREGQNQKNSRTRKSGAQHARTKTRTARARRAGKKR